MKLLAICAAFALTGCATSMGVAPLPPKATSAEMTEALKPYLVCMRLFAQTYDDGKSDAMTIALDIHRQCRPEWARVFETTTRGYNQAVVRQIASNTDQMQIQTALGEVLGYRAAKTAAAK
jgi:hypothetical protein